ncbi:hypothetical protein HU200_066254 [Digitaria exilis]|uniref:Uncharacterized protein n=1 Tax=Digitaria exilis TaxID=1010633 RepID=A0A835DT17_9POAL|nr:hypothetical protein HU200_066254 [Digitaria exilis]
MGLMMQYPVFMPPNISSLGSGPYLSSSLPSPSYLATIVSHSASSLPSPSPPPRSPLPPAIASISSETPTRPSPPLDGSTQRTRLLGFTSARDAELRRSGEAMAAATARAPAADKRYQSLRLLPRVPIPLPCFLVGVCGRCCCGRADEDARRWGCGDGGPESHQSVHPKVVFRPK